MKKYTCKICGKEYKYKNNITSIYFCSEKCYKKYCDMIATKPLDIEYKKV